MYKKSHPIYEIYFFFKNKLAAASLSTFVLTFLLQMQLVLLIQLNSFLAPGGLAFTWLTSVVKQLQSRPFCTTISVEKGMNKPTACGVDLNFQNKKKNVF